jgi:hypothetical protein
MYWSCNIFCLFEFSAFSQNINVSGVIWHLAHNLYFLHLSCLVFYIQCDYHTELTFFIIRSLQPEAKIHSDLRFTGKLIKSSSVINWIPTMFTPIHCTMFTPIHCTMIAPTYFIQPENIWFHSFDLTCLPMCVVRATWLLHTIDCLTKADT